MSKHCHWTFDDNEYAPMWNTGCNNTFSFTEDGIEENGFKYCPYCGNRIDPVQPEQKK